MLRRVLLAAACALAPLLLVTSVASASTTAPASPGYWIGATDGSVRGFGSAGDHGAVAGTAVESPIVCVASTSSGGGYWEVARDGGVYTFGDATFAGSAGNQRLNRPIVGMAASPSGNGYRLVASDGGIFSYGDATFLGSTGAMRLNQPIVGMATTPSGNGYWLVASDGGIFTFGDARFLGSTGAIHLNRPVVGMATTPSGNGYWLVASDGGIFTFGDARYLGSTGAIHLNRPVVGMATTPSGNGYWLVASDGGIFSYGDARYLGSGGGASSADVIGASRVGGAAACNAGSSVLTDRLAAASAYASARQGTTGVALVDTATGELVGNPASDVQMRSASIVKVGVAMALYARAESQRRELTAGEQSDLSAMIRVSDNDATSRLWSELGGPAVIDWLRQATGVTSTSADSDADAWGFTLTTAHDLAVIFATLVRGGPISPEHREEILEEMRNVTPSQRWGVAAAVHRSVAAVKNGWYPDTDVPYWRVHCGGVVDQPGAANRWVVVVTTRYPIGLGMGYGEDTCRDVAARLLPPDV